LPKVSRAETAPPPPTEWQGSSLGTRIDHVCRLRGWSLQRYGQEAGFASGVMSRLAAHTGRTGSSPDTLRRLADAGRVNIIWLMFGEGPVEPVAAVPGTMRAHPEWPTAFAEAKRRQKGIPEEFWEAAGEAVVPLRERLDWQYIVGLVRELYSDHQRGLDDGALK
jgi:hypothetical protein